MIVVTSDVTVIRELGTVEGMVVVTVVSAVVIPSIVVPGKTVVTGADTTEKVTGLLNASVVPRIGVKKSSVYMPAGKARLAWLIWAEPHLMLWETVFAVNGLHVTAGEPLGKMSVGVTGMVWSRIVRF